MANRAGSRLRALAQLVVAALLPFAVLEIGLATLDWSYHPPLLVPLWGGQNDRRLLDDDALYRPHPYWFWELRPGALIDPATGERVNRAGLRGPPPGPPGAAQLRIALLGDSTTYGLGVGAEETYAHHLGALAGVEVLNFGVPGYTAFQGAKLYPARVRAFAPDVVVLAYGAVNESTARDPDARERYAITSRTPPAAIAVSNFLMRYRAYQLLRFAVAAARGEARAAAETRRRFFANLERREAGGVYKRNVDVATFRESLLELIESANGDGARALLVSPPRSAAIEAERPELLEYTRAIFEVARAETTPVCDVRGAFRQLGDARLLRDAVHPGGRGHRAYAATLRDCLAREGWLPAGGAA